MVKFDFIIYTYAFTSYFFLHWKRHPSMHMPCKQKTASVLASDIFPQTVIRDTYSLLIHNHQTWTILKW